MNDLECIVESLTGQSPAFWKQLSRSPMISSGFISSHPEFPWDRQALAQRGPDVQTHPGISLRDYMVIFQSDQDNDGIVRSPGIRQLDLCITGFRYVMSVFANNPNITREFVMLTYPNAGDVTIFTYIS